MLENALSNMKLWLGILAIVVVGIIAVEYNHSSVMSDAGVFKQAEDNLAKKADARKAEAEVAKKAAEAQTDALKVLAEAVSRVAPPTAAPVTK